MKPVFRCSSLPRELNCHGSRSIVPLLNQRPGVDAWSGNMLHWMIADRLIRELGARPPAGGLLPPDVPKGFTVRGPNLWPVAWAVERATDFFPKQDHMEVESEFITEFDQFILTGHHDVHTINGAGTLYFGTDWKTGRKPVTRAEANLQVLGYVCQAKRAWTKLDRARFAIGSPYNDEEEGFVRWDDSLDFGGADLTEALDRLQRLVAETLADPLTCDTGPVQCAWCPAAGPLCPAYMAVIEFMKAALTPENLAAIQGTADDAQLADLVIAARTVARGMEDAEDMIKDRLAAVPVVTSTDGVQIRAKIEGGRYNVINPEGAFAALKEMLPEERIPHVLYYSTSRIMDEVAKQYRLTKGSQAEISARTVFEVLMKPHLEQGKRVKLIIG